MKKFFWLMATVLISSISLTSCGDDDDDSKTPSNPQESSSGTYNITASAVFDKELAKYGYMEVSYDYNGKTETFQLKQGDASDKFPTGNDFVTKLMQSFITAGVDYSSDNFIIRNVILNNVDNNVTVVFKSKFVKNEDHPSVSSDADLTMATPAVVGYAEAANGFIKYNTLVQFSVGIRPNKFEDWLNSQVKYEHTTTFSRY